MKYIKIIATAILLTTVSAVSFYGGREYESYYYNFDNLFEAHQELKDSCNKYYEAACLQADFIRYIIDQFDGETEMFNIGAEIENSYEEYFQELDNYNIWKTNYIKSMRDFDEYYWCY